MWIVRLALRRPYTFVVLAILILMLGILAILSTPKDIFPSMDIPVISVVWSYNGLSAPQMADRLVTPNERAMTTTVNNIEHIESQSLDGMAVIKVFFHQGVNISTALAQITSISQTLLRQLPPGTTPPLIVTYSASSVPILQMGLSGQGLSEQELYDLGNNFIRTQLANVEGASLPFPYGGKQRQLQVDLNTAALQSKGLSPLDVVNAISAQNLILPSGTAKIGTIEYDVEMNGSPTAAFLGLGTLCWENGWFDRAKIPLRKVLELDPENAQADLELGDIYVRAHKFDQALPFLQKALAHVAYHSFLVHADLGKAYAELGQAERAIAQLTQAAPMDTSGEIYYQLYKLYQKQRQVTLAQEALAASERLRRQEAQGRQRHLQRPSQLKEGGQLQPH